MRLGVIAAILGRAAWRGFRGSGVTAWVSVVTISVALFLVGAFSLVVVNMEGMLDRFGGDLAVTAYLEDDLTPEEAGDLAKSILEVDVIEYVAVVDKEEALERFRQMTGGAALLEGIPENPLPASLEMRLKPEDRSLEGFSILEEAVVDLPGIAELRHGREWIDGYARVASLIRISGYAIAVVLSLATLLIVANTIQLGLYARRDELDILDLVGASRTFMRTPFLLEGTLQGMLGGLLAAGLLWLCFLVLLPSLEYGLTFLLGQTEPRFFGFAEILRLVLGGALLGLVGSMAALLDRRS